MYMIMAATLSVSLKAGDKFGWDYCNKDGKAGLWEGTPHEFYKTFASDKYVVRGSDSRSVALC